MGDRAAALAAFVIATAAASQAGAVVTVIGSSRAVGCMEAAMAESRARIAIQTCTVALEEDPLTPKDRAGTLNNRGVILMNRGEMQAALADFQEAVRVNPELGEAVFNRGSTLIALGRYAEGLADVDRGLTLGLRQPEKAYYNRAIAREELDDPKGAYLDYKRAARLKPDWRLPQIELARFNVTRP
jgi:tetratricopeptide (TPR) repeat protein